MPSGAWPGPAEQPVRAGERDHPPMLFRASGNGSEGQPFRRWPSIREVPGSWTKGKQSPETRSKGAKTRTSQHSLRFGRNTQDRPDTQHAPLALVICQSPTRRIMADGAVREAAAWTTVPNDQVCFLSCTLSGAEPAPRASRLSLRCGPGYRLPDFSQTGSERRFHGPARTDREIGPEVVGQTEQCGALSNAVRSVGLRVEKSLYPAASCLIAPAAHGPVRSEPTIHRYSPG